jgi:hypothetical protein
VSPIVSTPEEVDEILRSWWQGDFVLGAQPFVYCINPFLALAPKSQEWIASYPGESIVEMTIQNGLMVLTQTCDIQRDCRDRPFMEVAPLVTLADSGEFTDVIDGARPRYATVPPLHSRRMAADLDRSLTVEKAAVATWERMPGCTTDKERRELGRHLAQQRGRAALPDEFTTFMRPLERRWKEVKRKDTLEGQTFRAIAEVRVHAFPRWDAETVELFFWLILKDEAADVNRSSVMDGWFRKLGSSERFVSLKGAFTRYDLMKVATYFDSDRLDLDRLSPSD